MSATRPRGRVWTTRSEALRFARFGTVGVLNTLVTLLAFALLSRAGTPAAPASAIAFAAGAANGYALNRRWTFRAQGSPATLVRYVAVAVFGAVLSALGLTLVSADLELRRMLAECLVIPVITVLTYTLSRRLVFHDAPGA